MPVSPDVAPRPATATAEISLPAETDVRVWKAHRFREEPGRAPVVAAAIAVVAGLGWILFAHPLPVLLVVAALIGAVSEFLFPTTYRLTNRGAHSACGLSQLFISWEDVRRATHGADGVHLSPFDGPHALDSFRGVRLRYGAEDKDTVLADVRRLWKEDGA